MEITKKKKTKGIKCYVLLHPIWKLVGMVTPILNQVYQKAFDMRYVEGISHFMAKWLAYKSTNRMAEKLPDFNYNILILFIVDAKLLGPGSRY